MNNSELRYNLTGLNRLISGKRHELVERVDGMRFYLDDAFMYVLQNPEDQSLGMRLEKLGADSVDLADIVFVLMMAGLIVPKGKDGDNS